MQEYIDQIAAKHNLSKQTVLIVIKEFLELVYAQTAKSLKKNKGE